MAACDVIMAPAIDEPLARNVLEAQALGVPVIVSTDGGLREVIQDGENGLLRDPYDIAGWIDDTKRMLDNHVFAAALAHSGRTAVAGLTPPRHAERVAGIYRGLSHRTRQAA
jgi:glycosyltransferase involved in cell wall biosynthesis